MVHSRKMAVIKLIALIDAPTSLVFNCWHIAASGLRKERQMDFNSEQHFARGLSRKTFSQFCIGIATSKLESRKESRATVHSARFLSMRSMQQWRTSVLNE